ncbi:hypothetical protein Catovirus_1_922 [Catovirus CTV1]|uniref:Uridine kinase n=1 Tax=Catovirus CTV1 TaxID=1977631 RepID=A0A1V0SAY3_9VIRU|nr:hypothetical protein Catovirus_1_922 [Catovirus CTV1]
MNIVEAYIKFKNKLIIIISGISGSGKTELSKNISKLLDLKLINLNKYCRKDYNKTIKLQGNTEVINWDSDDVYDWDKFNKDVNDNYKNGVVLTGVSFPRDKINFTPDYHIQIKLSKQNLLKKRSEILDELEDNCSGTSENKIDKNLEYTLFNQVTYPYYLNLTNNSDITKFLNANEYINLSNDEYNEKLYDEAFDYLMKQISKAVYSQ